MRRVRVFSRASPRFALRRTFPRPTERPAVRRHHGRWRRLARYARSRRERVGALPARLVRRWRGKHVFHGGERRAETRQEWRADALCRVLHGGLLGRRRFGPQRPPLLPLQRHRGPGRQCLHRRHGQFRRSQGHAQRHHFHLRGQQQLRFVGRWRPRHPGFARHHRWCCRRFQRQSLHRRCRLPADSQGRPRWHHIHRSQQRRHQPLGTGLRRERQRLHCRLQCQCRP